jgi:hypothetical protein
MSDSNLFAVEVCAVHVVTELLVDIVQCSHSAGMHITDAVGVKCSCLCDL